MTLLISSITIGVVFGICHLIYMTLSTHLRIYMIYRIYDLSM